MIDCVARWLWTLFAPEGMLDIWATTLWTTCVCHTQVMCGTPAQATLRYNPSSCDKVGVLFARERARLCVRLLSGGLASIVTPFLRTSTAQTHGTYFQRARVSSRVKRPVLRRNAQACWFLFVRRTRRQVQVDYSIQQWKAYNSGKQQAAASNCLRGAEPSNPATLPPRYMSTRAPPLSTTRQWQQAAMSTRRWRRRRPPCRAPPSSPYPVPTARARRAWRPPCCPLRVAALPLVLLCCASVLRPVAPFNHSPEAALVYCLVHRSRVGCGTP